VREREETEAKLELAGALTRLSTREQELLVAEQELERARGEQRLVTSESHTVSAAELHERQAFLEHVEVRRHESAARLQHQTTEVADRDADLTDAATKHEMLKRLRERQRQEHEREFERRENAALDELSVMRVKRGPA
jgi:flagellar export protein FliJ